MWHMTKHVAGKSLNLAVAFWLCDFVAPLLEQPDRYDLLPGCKCYHVTCGDTRLTRVI